MSCMKVTLVTQRMMWKEPCLSSLRRLKVSILEREREREGERERERVGGGGEG